MAYAITPATPTTYAFDVTPSPAPATQGFPGDWLQVRDEGVDVGDANVEVIDFTGDPEFVTVTRGVGENSHVVTVRLALTSCAPLFLDTFTGGAGAVTAHLPDIYPAGFVWSTPSPSLDLDGAGLAVLPAGVPAATNRAPFTGVTPMAVGSRFVVEMIARMPG